MKMTIRRKTHLIVAGAMLWLAVLACRIEPPKIVLQDTATPIVETEVITQVVTQIITPTPRPTNTPLPSPTPFPSPTPTWDPMSAPIYYPLPNCVASRLHIGDQAMVSWIGGPNAIRWGLDLHEDNILTYAQPGSILTILDGPWCSHGWIVWFVQMADGTRGFTPEGNGEEYWLVPLPRQ